MPNRRDTTIAPLALEQARPWPPGRFADPEPQERRGAPGSRDLGQPAGRRREEQAAGPRGGAREPRGPEAVTGVNPLPPIDPAMPWLKPGDQGG